MKPFSYDDLTLDEAIEALKEKDDYISTLLSAKRGYEDWVKRLKAEIDTLKNTKEVSNG